MRETNAKMELSRKLLLAILLVLPSIAFGVKIAKNHNDFSVENFLSRTKRDYENEAKHARQTQMGQVEMPYVIDITIFNMREVSLIQDALKYLQKRTCLLFLRLDFADDSYLNFTRTKCGCCKEVNKNVFGPQYISLTDNCMKKNFIVRMIADVVSTLLEPPSMENREMGMTHLKSEKLIEKVNEILKCPTDMKTLQGRNGDIDSSLDGPKNRQVWRIVVNDGETIRLNIFSLEISNDNCESGYLEIIDESLPSYNSSKRFCSESEVEPYESKSNHLIVVFHNPELNQNHGFYAAYRAECSKILHIDDDWTFASPNFPYGYSENLYCTYDITVTEGYYVKLDVPYINVLCGNYDKENGDQLMFLDGHDSDSKQIGNVCGFNEKLEVKSESNKMRVEFLTSSMHQTKSIGFVAILHEEKK